jgi:hypothetical protein
MKHLIRIALVAMMGFALAGCEWSGGGEGEGGGSWSSRYNFVNFSGNYRGAGGGGFLVSEYTGAAITTDTSSSNTSVESVSGENGGSTGLNKTLFTGQTAKRPVKPNTFSLVIGSVDGAASDNGAGVLSGTFKYAGTNWSGTGTIQYETGAWRLQLPLPGLTVDRPILLTYNYTIGGSSSSGGSSSASAGSSGVSIYAFNVEQEGNKLRIVDNNGSVYEGRFGNIRTTGGADQDSQSPTFNNGDQVIATFEAGGKSKAGIGVKMTGSFQATISGVSSSSSGSTTMTLSGRTILGTWIEDGGKTGDINGQAASVSASTTSSTL